MNPPPSVPALFHLALAQHARGHRDAAASLCRAVLADQPDCGQALDLAGVIACDMGDFKGGGRALELAIAVDPATGPSYANLAVARQAGGALAVSAALWRRAVALAPEEGRARQGLGAALVLLDHRPAGAAAFIAAITLAPDSATAWAGLAAARKAVPESGLAAYRRAWRLDPRHAGIWANLADLSRVSGDAAAAVAAYRRALALAPDDAEVARGLAGAALEMGRRCHAIRAASAATALDPGSVEGFILLGRAYGNEGRGGAPGEAVGEGEAALRTAIAREITNAEAHFHLAALLAATGREAPAAMHFKMAIGLRPDFAAARARLDALALPSDGPAPARPAGAQEPDIAVVDGRHGEMRFFSRDTFVGRSLALYGEWSEEENAICGPFLRPGDVVVEAGANIGSLTLFLARAVGPTGRVHAFEPQTGAFRLLERNLAVNGLSQGVAHHAALAERPGWTLVPVLDPAFAINFGGVAVGIGEGEPVPVETIDGLGLDALRLIKADVEGMERQVILGALATIARCRPVLYLEVEHQALDRELVDLVAGLDYRIRLHMPMLFNPANFAGQPLNVFERVASRNLLCVPAEFSP